MLTKQFFNPSPEFRQNGVRRTHSRKRYNLFVKLYNRWNEFGSIQIDGKKRAITWYSRKLRCMKKAGFQVEVRVCK